MNISEQLISLKYQKISTLNQYRKNPQKNTNKQQYIINIQQSNCKKNMKIPKKKQKRPQKFPIPSTYRSLQTQSLNFPIKQLPTRVSIGDRYIGSMVQSNINSPSIIKIKCKKLQQIFLSIKNILQSQLDNLLANSSISQIYQHILQSQLFRIKLSNKDLVKQQLSKVIQACQLLYSKLHNNQKVKDVLHVKGEQDLLLFFKHLFGKPYTVCNFPNFRKVLNTIWQHQIFDTFDPQKMADHLRLWAAGIEFPLNPAAIPLHKLVFTNPQLIKKHALLLCNNVTYCNIDGGDCMGLTPLLLSVHSNRINAYNEIIKSGANLFKCPLTIIANKKQVLTSKKNSKQMIEIHLPIKQRKQYNIFQILLHHKQYQQLVNILSNNEIYKLKKMKKNYQSIHQNIYQIPNCYLQIHWKTYKGFLSFKQFPKDIIMIYKKFGSIRIDYHVDDLQYNKKSMGNYSILIRTTNQQGESKLQYYFIDHNKKKLHNFMREIDSQKLRLRYEQLVKFGNIEQQYITTMKSTASKTQQKQSILDIDVQYSYQNVTKAPLYQFKTLQIYQRALFDSQIINYTTLQQSQTDCSIKQNIGSIPKIKSKVVKNWNHFNIQFIQQKINLQHLVYILNLIDQKSTIFLKILGVFKMLLSQQIYHQNYCNKLPQKMVVELGGQFNMQVQIKNVNYMQLDDAVFQTDFRAKTMEYEQQQPGLQSLQQTMIMEQNYSINMSSFLGKAQKISNVQEQQANYKFLQILSKQILKSFSDQEDNAGNNKKKDQGQEDI